MTVADEYKYLKLIKKYPEYTFLSVPEAKQEGFEYFFEKLKGNKKDLRKLIKEKFLSSISALKITLRYMPKMKLEQKKSYRSIMPYLKELENTGKLSNDPIKFDNEKIYDELNSFIAQNFGHLCIGFTEIPQNLIFKDKGTLFKYALIVIQEMQRDKINNAPNLDAGGEVMRVYASLGKIVNIIAEWLRNHGIKAQSNHPMGGLVCTPPLAGKAGLGWIGRSGMLITPEFGPRLRIAPIFIQNKIFDFTDSTRHKWIEKYCAKCGLCQKNCPTGAIFSEKQILIENIEGIGTMRTCIDREKCWPEFNRTMGCSICLKVCPFSQGIEMYEKIRKTVEK